MVDTPGNGEGGAGAVANTGEVTEIRHVKIKVNGIVIDVTEEVEIREILIKAKGAGAVEGVVEEYAIERVDKEGELKIGETITVRESERFVAVPTGSTPVARSAQSSGW